MKRTSARKRSFVVVAITGSLAIAGWAGAATNVGGPIFADVTWTLAGSPYIVTNSIIVGAGATVTIQPGVTVRINNGLGIQVGSPEGFGPGTLLAIGSAAQPILFTSNDAVPAPGKWNNILFSSLAVDAVYTAGGVYQSGSILQHAVVEFAGGGGVASGAVTVSNASPFLDAVEVRKASRSGIYVDAALAPSLRISHCDVHDCGAPGQSGGGLYLLNGQSHVISDNTFHNNATSTGGGMYLQSATSVTVSGNSFLSNNAGSGGGFYGTGLASLVFQGNTSSNNTASNFGGMYLDGASVQLLSNTFASNTASSYAGFYCASGGATINGNTIANNTASSTYGGSYLTGNSQVITANQWTGNTATGRAGVHTDGSSTTFTNNMVTGNHTVGANTDVGGMEASGSGGTFVGNTFQGNECQRNAGGLYLSGNGHSLADNTIDDNSAGNQGGGVFLDATNTTWTHNTFTNNHANLQGGGMFVQGAGTSIAGNSTTGVYNVVIGNSSANGAAIYLNVANGANGNLAAQYVCWGTNDQSVVQSQVFDFFDNSALGIVLVFPLVLDCGLGTPCPADFDGDGSVGSPDLAILLGQWSGGGEADLDGSGAVGSPDLAILLGAWGACP